MIPKPLARVRISYGLPFEVAEGESGLTEGLARAAEGLHEVSKVIP
jgi:hypothetical protein